MDYHIRRSSKLFSIFSAALLFISCAQNSLDINQSEMTVVFEYSDEENLPSARLCAFVESDSDSRRSGLLQLSTKKDGFIWNAQSPLRFKSGDKFWTGYTNFLMQKNEPFPLDSYRILIQNADEKEAEEVFDFNYDSSFYNLKASEVEEKMKSLGAVKKIAIYDESHSLLYYGDLKDNLSSSRKIWNVYSKANYFNVIWQTKDNTVICILPKELVVPDEND
ncbi:hypothetical protein [Treponema sp. C6A8]|uniref:hypothetical protein n=1 Tax=Treponema sp. C6A8 TaxID=1410609 RepID=UPI000482617A|nr:hypothetical protein [Treponema sp. C6A8]